MSSIILQTLKAFFEEHPLDKGEVVGVAVSGGADSLCLAIALAELSRDMPFVVKAVTVDHDLRPESAKEASMVHRVMQSCNVDHDTVVWTGPKPISSVEEKAREARYQLIFDWCHHHGIRKLFVAHQMTDQVETFWERLARGSGVDGLSSILPVRFQNNIKICRPFLTLSKDVLKAFLNDRSIAWAEDQMNFDDHYERVRWRQKQQDLSQLGLTTKAVTRSVRRIQRAKTALDFYAKRAFQSIVHWEPEGFVWLDELMLIELPDEIRIRLLQKIVQEISFVNHDDVDEVLQKENSEISERKYRIISLDSLEKYVLNPPLKATLGGCFLIRKNGYLFISKESKRMGPSQKISAYTLTQWDRFWVYSTCPILISSGKESKQVHIVSRPESEYQQLPYLIRCSIPKVISNELIQLRFMKENKKELEKLISLDYKEDKHCVYIMPNNGREDKNE